MEHILIEKHEHIAVITINRPTKLNALNKETIQELHEAFSALNKEQAVKAIIITRISGTRTSFIV
jgi:enoyl-CoA hydratase